MAAVRGEVCGSTLVGHVSEPLPPAAPKRRWNPNIQRIRRLITAARSGSTSAPSCIKLPAGAEAHRSRFAARAEANRS